MTAEQLEAARAERMRQNGHGAVTIEDVRTWIEETGLCIFLPRSVQAGFTAPTFVEAVAGERTTEPTLDLIREAESLLVRLEGEGIAVRLNLSGQPGDQPDYVVAGWVLPYIYALRGDRDWRRAPQLTGSRQVSPLAVQVAKHLESGNQTALQLRDALGRETSESAVFRALHELWKQLRVIPVVPEVSVPALWQPLRQRFQKAIAEGASTSQVTAISVLASIYLQAVIAAGMEDVELFLAPLTSRSKIREVVRGLAATRQVHSTSLGHGPLYYVAGTLPDFPAVPSYQSSQLGYRNSSYRSPYADEYLDSGLDLPAPSRQESRTESRPSLSTSKPSTASQPTAVSSLAGSLSSFDEDEDLPTGGHAISSSAAEPIAEVEPEPVFAAKEAPAAKAAVHRPRPGKTAASAHPRERNRSTSSGDDRRHAPAPRGNSRPAASNGRSSSNGHHAANGNGSKSASGPTQNGAHKPARTSRPAARPGSRPAWGKASNGTKPNGNGHTSSRPATRSSSGHAEARPASRNGAGKPASNGHANGAKTAKPASANGRPIAKSATRPSARPAPAGAKHKPTTTTASASKRYSFAGQAKQAPKPAAAKHRSTAGKGVANGSRPVAKAHAARPSASKRRG
ncbi:MAG TPA: hypothetical protein VL346_07245 [Acidobacteriaceae bacterium]|nr:hypothetical protein [Acidobacteriaceae bacterium]